MHPDTLAVTAVHVPSPAFLPRRVLAILLVLAMLLASAAASAQSANAQLLLGPVRLTGAEVNTSVWDERITMSARLCQDLECAHDERVLTGTQGTHAQHLAIGDTYAEVQDEGFWAGASLRAGAVVAATQGTAWASQQVTMFNLVYLTNWETLTIDVPVSAVFTSDQQAATGYGGHIAWRLKVYGDRPWQVTQSFLHADDGTPVMADDMLSLTLHNDDGSYFDSFGIELHGAIYSTVQAVPEPTMGLMLVAGIVLSGLLARQRRPR